MILSAQLQAAVARFDGNSLMAPAFDDAVIFIINIDLGRGGADLELQIGEGLVAAGFCAPGSGAAQAAQAQREER